MTHKPVMVIQVCTHRTPDVDGCGHRMRSSRFKLRIKVVTQDEKFKVLRIKALTTKA